MRKIVRPCTTLVWSDVHRKRTPVDLFCEIETRQKSKGCELSISGVEGPTSNGNARGSCGQIDMHIGDVDAYVHEYAPGWDKAKFEWFLGIWREWHLNDMRAGCEHQRKFGWGEDKLKVATLKLWPRVLATQRQLKKRAEDNLRDGKLNMTDDFTFEELVEYRLPYNITVPGENLEELILEKNINGYNLELYYMLDKMEEKLSAWVYEKEHPQGVLMKPCPVCGYEFGSAWLYEPLPESVVEFLTDLPDTDIAPVWV